MFFFFFKMWFNMMYEFWVWSSCLHFLVIEGFDRLYVYLYGFVLCESWFCFFVLLNNCCCKICWGKMAMIDEPLYPIAVLFDELKNVDLVIVASQSCVAAVSLLCFSYNFRKYGNWRFLLVDRYSGQLATFRNRYIQQIQVHHFPKIPKLLFVCLNWEFYAVHWWINIATLLWFIRKSSSDVLLLVMWLSGYKRISMFSTHQRI